MSRSGVEEKPTWASVPFEIRESVTEITGSRVVRGVRVWGGYSATPTFRLKLEDGRRVFFKGANSHCTGFAESALRNEVRIYGQLADVLSPWVPKFVGTFQTNDWNVLLLEDLGPKCAPPWVKKHIEISMGDMAEFHLHTAGLSFPQLLRSFERTIQFENWPWFTDLSDEIERVASMAGSAQSDVRDWLHGVEPIVSGHIRNSFSSGETQCLIHGDLRSDNIRIVGVRLRFFDVPHLFEGLPAWDLVEFVQTISLESEFTPEAMVEMYLRRNTISDAQIDSALAWYLVFFAQQAWQPDIPGLPRLRWFQRQQFGTLALWAARRFSLPEPIWAHQLGKA